MDALLRDVPRRARRARALERTFHAWIDDKRDHVLIRDLIGYRNQIAPGHDSVFDPVSP